MGAEGIELVGGTPEQTDAFILAEMNKWQKVIKETGTGEKAGSE